MFDQLGVGVFRRRYDSFDLDVGAVIGEDGVLVVDTRASHHQADQFREELRTLTSLPVRWVVDTHYHWDHTFGNARFSGAEIWGHVACRDALARLGDDMKEGAKAWLPPEQHAEIDEVVITPPTHTFATRVSIDIGREVVLTHHGLAHTNSDVVISVPDASVSFVGDIVEESAPPNFGDSFPLTWPLTLRLAIDEMHGTVVPGHGDVVDLAFVRHQHQELVGVAELASQVINDEISIEEAADRGPYPGQVMVTAINRAVEVG